MVAFNAFNISERDIDALARIAYAEAANIASQTGDLKAAYGSVVDTILNRAAADRGYLGGGDIQDVIDHTNHPKYYQFTPIAGTRNKSWTGLSKPPQAVYDAVRSHLRDLQEGDDNVAGKNTHYLNPNVPGTEGAKKSWAADWQSWPSVGVAPIQHAFGNPDNLTVPDYSVSFQPATGFPAPPMPEDMSPASQYAHYGLTRSLAPDRPVDREFHTPQSVYARAAETLGAAGMRGLNGRGAPLSAPVMPVERGGALPPARDPASISPPRPDNFNYAGPPGLGGPGGTYLAGLPAQPVPGVLPGFEPSPMRPDNFAYQGPKGNFQVPGPVPPTEAIPAMPYAPELPPSMTPPPARPSIPEVQLPDLAPPPMPNPRNGWNDAKRGGILGGVPGALAAPGIAQIGRNARTKAQGGNIGLFAGIPAAYRAAGAGFRGAMQNAFGSLPPPTPFSVGRGLAAIEGVRGGAFGPGATAYSVSHPGASWSVNAYGHPEFSSQHGFTGRPPDGF